MLAGKVGIVTGASRGLGLAAARALCQAGASVLLTDIAADKSEAAVAALMREGYVAAFLTHDIRDAGQWDHIVEQAVDRFGRLDFLVNNAGKVSSQNFEDASVEEFAEILNVNLLGAFRGMQAVLGAMRRSGGGSIINIASSATAKTAPPTALYGASKAALASLSKAAALHLAEDRSGIRVNTVHPGPVDTDFLHEGLLSLGIDDPSGLAGSIPMGRLGQPQDIAGAIVFLASDSAGFVTGAELFVDGGLTAG